MPTESLPLSLEDLHATRASLGDAILHTAQWHNDTLSAALGTSLAFKFENLQRAGSFKIRGATNKIAQLLAADAQGNGVIAASAGNHAQGVARAAGLAGLRAVVVMPTNAPLTKVEACRKMGAEIHLHGTNLEQATELAQEIGQRDNLAFLSPYDDWDVIAGQASCGLEMLEDTPDITLAVVPLGGGGLLSGVALALKLQNPAIRVIGVQTDTIAPWRHFLADGSIEEVAPDAHTIADGIKVKRAGKLTRRVIARHVDDIVTVSDNAIAEAIVTLLEHTHTIGEGAGVTGLAALMSGKIPVGDQDRVVCVVSGGNVDTSLVGRSIDYGLASSGRLINLSVTIQDTPGNLAHLLDTVARLSVNIRHVEHRRGELHVPVGMTQVILEMEARGPEHQDQLVALFREEGLPVDTLTTR